MCTPPLSKLRVRGVIFRPQNTLSQLFCSAYEPYNGEMQWNSVSLRAKLALGFGTGLFILIALATTALIDTNRLTQAAASRATSRQFLWNLEQLLSVIRSSEDETRGFLLTGNERFVNDFHDDSGTMAGIFADLEKGEDAQRDAIRALRPLAEAKIASLEQLIATRPSAGLNAAIAQVNEAAADTQFTALRS